jgi:hypothetical protein
MHRGHGAELRGKLFREESPDHGAASGGELSQLSVPNLQSPIRSPLIQSVVATGLRAVLVKFSPGMDSP